MKVVIYSAIIGALLSSSFVYISLEDGFAYPHSWGVSDGWTISSCNGVSNHSGCDILASVFNSLSGVSTGMDEFLEVFLQVVTLIGMGYICFFIAGMMIKLLIQWKK